MKRTCNGCKALDYRISSEDYYCMLGYMEITIDK